MNRETVFPSSKRPKPATTRAWHTRQAATHGRLRRQLTDSPKLCCLKVERKMSSVGSVTVSSCGRFRRIIVSSASSSNTCLAQKTAQNVTQLVTRRLQRAADIARRESTGRQLEKQMHARAHEIVGGGGSMSRGSSRWTSEGHARAFSRLTRSSLAYVHVKLPRLARLETCSVPRFYTRYSSR